MESLTIGKVAHLAGVGVETVRFYERRGLIPVPPRRESGYRQYPRETVSRIQFIKRAKALGFTLREIGELLSLRIDPETTCRDMQDRARIKIAEIDGRIKTLERIRRTLVQLTDACHGKASVSECPVLEALEDEMPCSLSN